MAFPSPTTAELMTQHLNKVNLFDTVYNQATVIVNMQDTIIRANFGDYTSEVAAVVDGVRANMQNALVLGRNCLIPDWFQLMKTLNVEFDGEDDMWHEAYDWMDENSVYFLERGQTVTVGSFAAATKGKIEVTTVDHKGYPLQNIGAGSINLKCIQDQNLGAVEGEEVFQMRPDYGGIDLIERIDGINLGVDEYPAINALTPGLINDSSFEDLIAGTASTVGTATVGTSDLGDWELNTGVITDIIGNNTLYYRKDDDDYTYGVSLGFVGNATSMTTEIRQHIESPFEPYTPYYLELDYYDACTVGSASLNLKLGTITASTAVTGGGGWNKLKIPLGTSQYYENFRPIGTLVDQRVFVGIECVYDTVADSGCEIYVDNVVFTRMGSIGNMPTVLLAGSIDFARDDTIQISCAYDTVGRRQRSMHRFFDRTMPCGTAAGTLSE